jgi:GAF domain-containing protein/methyl-accepting chemotaxis protein
MSITVPVSQEIRRKNLNRIAILSTVLALMAGILYGYLGITTKNWYNFVVAGSFSLIAGIAILIFISRRSERPVVGAWHFISAIIFTALLISAVQANAGAEVGSAVLIITLVLVIQILPSKQAMRGALLGAAASLACGILAFYSPVPQIANETSDMIIVWVARASTLAFLVMIMMQFRNLSLANKILISFLGVVVLISMTFNIVMSFSTVNTMTNQVGQQLLRVAEGRSVVLGDYLNGRLEALQTLALDETIRQSVGAANDLKPDLAGILELDEEWRQAVASGVNNPLVTNRLSNSLSKDLLAFQSLSPENIEVFVTDQAGALVSATNLTSDYYQADEDWWISAFNAGDGDVYISQPEFDESAGALSILMAVPIYDTRHGNLIGILRSTISIDSLVDVLNDPIGETGEVDIYFPDGTMLDTKTAEYEDINPDSLVAIQESSNQIFRRAIFEGQDSILAQTQLRSQSNDSRINDLGWTVIVSQDTSEALAPVYQQVRISSLFGALMAGISALLSLVVAQRLTKPITNLTETANEIKRGNLEARATVNSQDEIGQLSETFNDMTTQLQETLLGLETRVAERTAELEESSQKLQTRADQFEAIAQLARTITSIQDPETLLPRITKLVSQQFGFYHVGLFLLDESRKYAVLSAANSEGGQRMLARKHRLGVGQTGIVGYVTSTGNPRIALDTGTDAVYFDNPDLPDTRSEMALPLRIGKIVIGALDVQSTEPNAFSEDDVEVLSILADEVSVAIENARLFEESQRVLADAQSAFGEFTRTAWQQMIARDKVVRYELSGTSIRSLKEPATNNGSSMTIPIKLRDRVVGTMNISPPENEELDPDEVDIINALAQRVSIAIENATLLEETRRRATRESMFSDISAKLSASAEIEHIMQVAVSELRQALGASEVSLKIGSDDEPTT